MSHNEQHCIHSYTYGIIRIRTRVILAQDIFELLHLFRISLIRIRSPVWWVLHALSVKSLDKVVKSFTMRDALGKDPQSTAYTA